MDPDLSWVPDGMDRSSCTRVDVRVCAYPESGNDGTHVWHASIEKLKIVDRDCLNLKDFRDELDIKHGLDQKFVITFWDKVSLHFAEINHDRELLQAIDMYWNERMLPIMVSVVCEGDNSGNTTTCVP